MHQPKGLASYADWSRHFSLAKFPLTASQRLQPVRIPQQIGQRVTVENQEHGLQGFIENRWQAAGALNPAGGIVGKAFGQREIAFSVANDCPDDDLFRFAR